VKAAGAFFIKIPNDAVLFFDGIKHTGNCHQWPKQQAKI
jgi:hypothetical protein